MSHAFKPRPSVTDYLNGEQVSDLCHEYVDGEIYAMAGAGEAHNLIALNVAAKLCNLVRGGPCRVFISDMKLHVATWNAFYYPDVMVVCDPGDAQSLYKQSPSLVVEVLSPSTESIDRREKMLAYRTLPSLRDYLLIAQDRRHIELYRRAADDHWVLTTLVDTNAGTIPLDCVQAGLSLDEAYKDVSLAASCESNGLALSPSSKPA